MLVGFAIPDSVRQRGSKLAVSRLDGSEFGSGPHVLPVRVYQCNLMLRKGSFLLDCIISGSIVARGEGESCGSYGVTGAPLTE